MKYFVALADAPFFEHWTVTGHEPRAVLGPTVHVHETLPEPSVVVGPRTCTPLL